jgi:hypothetical protein
MRAVYEFKKEEIKLKKDKRKEKKNPLWDLVKIEVRLQGTV